MTESDYLWDNFQDQLVVQTRLGQLAVLLQAVKVGDAAPADSFSPRILPQAKAPSLKVLDLIERQAQDEAGPGSDRRRMPTPPSTDRPHSSSVSRSNSRDPKRHPAAPPIPALSLSTDITSQLEAKAVILKLRARRSTQQALQSTPSAAAAAAVVEGTCEGGNAPSLASGIETTAQPCDLSEFQSLVVAAKQQVAQNAAKARSELDYYRDFMHQQVQEAASHPIASVVDPLVVEPSITNPKNTVKRAAGIVAKPVKLPSLQASSSDLLPPAPCSGNQHEGAIAARSLPSPAKVAVVSGVPTAKSRVLPAKPSRIDPHQNRLPHEIPHDAATATVTTKASTSSSSVAVPKKTTCKKPAVSKSKIKANGAAKSSSMIKRTSSMITPTASDTFDWSDFDGPEPDVDAAPVMPDDFDGIARLEDDDEEVFRL